MNNEEMIKMAVASGFSAAVTGTESIVFDPVFRPYCAENICGMYGKNYSCPEACGTPEEMRNRVVLHKFALVLSTCHEIRDFKQTEKLRAAKTCHNSAMLRLIESYRSAGKDGFMIGSGGCALCKPCKLVLGEPCAHPSLAYSCMSAYCIHVKALAESCGMPYDYKDGKLYLFGAFVFD